ncbi:MAG: hypothetical protein ACJAZQ_002147 [Cognaticolwellia sp.]|jgi:hypothetical protein
MKVVWVDKDKTLISKRQINNNFLGLHHLTASQYYGFI